MNYLPHIWKRSIWLRGLLGLTSVLCLAARTPADVLVTVHGESLSGELSRIVDGILVFRTSLRGQMMMPAPEAKSLTTETAWAVTDAGGTVYIGRFVSSGIVTGQDGEGADRVTPLRIADVVSASRLPSAMEPGAKETQEAWTGYANAGVRAYAGAEDGVAPHMSLGLRGADSRGNVDVNLRFDATSEDGFPGFFRGRFDVMGAADQPWAPFIQGRAERDRYNALDLRTGLSVGVRYAFETDERSQLAGLIGLGGTLGRWDRDEIADGDIQLGANERTATELNAHLELRYSQALLGGATLENRVFVLPSLTDADHFRAGAETSIIYPVTRRLQLRLDMLLDYEHDPVFGELDRIDTSLGASIQLDF